MTLQEVYRMVGRYLNTGHAMMSSGAMLEMVTKLTGMHYPNLREGLLAAEQDLAARLRA